MATRRLANLSKRIIDYKVVIAKPYKNCLLTSGSEIKEFETEIQEYLKKGYQPHGSLGLVTNGNYYYRMTQPMVLYEEENMIEKQPGDSLEGQSKQTKSFGFFDEMMMK